nr:two-component response regulator-like APRR7 [Quercus suber]
MSIDSDDGDKELQELNSSLLDGKKTVKDGVVMGEEQGVLKEGKLKIDGITKDVKDGQVGVFQVHAAPQMPQQQSQGAMVCWERFLHVRSLKVLLVENDDCTRHVVAALLRNCGYEVTEAADVLQAWKILEDLRNHIDLVLTEVVMPYLSGIGLLCKIMSHKTRPNLPVIMMSSYASMSLVFKCLSKGAVDFLVKPIRKNELKNLWQHVWRRCQSSSGSGSESGSQNQSSGKSRSVEKCKNNSCCNDEDDSESIGLDVGGGSDIGSGTQSSWTKRAVEVDSPQPDSPYDQMVECPDSTCAQVDSTCAQDVRSNAETSGNKLVPVAKTRKLQKKKEECGIPEDNAPTANSLEMGVPRNLGIQLEFLRNDLLEPSSSKLTEQISKEQLNLNCESPSIKLKNEHATLIGDVTISTQSQMDSMEFEAQNRNSKISDINNKANNDTEELPSLELSLKRPRVVKDTGTEVQDDRYILRHSDLSAFSRYKAVSNTNKAHPRNFGSSSPHGICLDVTMKESLHDIQFHSSGNPPNQFSNVGSNNIDMGSAINTSFAKSLIKKSSILSSVKHLHPSDFHSIKECPIYAPTAVLVPSKGTHKELQNEHLYHHKNHHHHLVHNMQQQWPPDHSDLSLKKMAAAAPHCGSSNVLGGPEGNTVNYDVDGSSLSNGQNGSSLAVEAEGIDLESDGGISGNSGRGGPSGSGNTVGHNKFEQREAALTKFHWKRKERCFQKKVQYQSRKRHAEQ